MSLQLDLREGQGRVCVVILVYTFEPELREKKYKARGVEKGAVGVCLFVGVSQFKCVSILYEGLRVDTRAFS